MSESRLLPVWAEDLRRRYLRGEASMFLLHGNVYDAVIEDGKAQPLSAFPAGPLLRDSKQTIALDNMATGVRFAKRGTDVSFPEELLAPGTKDKTLAAL